MFGLLSKRTILSVLVFVLLMAELLLFFLPKSLFVANVNGVSSDVMRIFLVKIVFVLFFSAILALLFHRLFEKYFSRIGIRFVIGLSIVFMIVFSLLSVFRFLSFNIPPPDLWIFNQAMWNSLNGGFMHITRNVSHYFAEHFSPFLILLLPFYFLFQSPMTLIALQNIAIFLSVIPIFFIAKTVLNDRFSPVIISFSFLLFPALEFISMREFHTIAFAIPLLLCVFFFFLKNNLKLFSVFFFLSLLVDETVSLALLFIAIAFFAFSKKKIYLIFALIAIVWFAVSVFFVIPFFRQAPYAFLYGESGRFSDFGKSPSEVFSSILFNPLNALAYAFSLQKIGYLILFFLPLLFLSFFSPWLVVSFPFFAHNLLTSNPFAASIYFQYNAIIIPIVFVSLIFGIKNFSFLLNRFFKINGKKAMVFCLSLVFFSSVFSNLFFSPSPVSVLDPLPIQSNFSLKKYEISSHDLVLWKAISLIPKNAGVAADDFVLAQVSGAKEVNYLFVFIDKADYAIADASNKLNSSSRFSKKELADYMEKKGFARVFEEDGVFLFRKNV